MQNLVCIVFWALSCFGASYLKLCEANLTVTESCVLSDIDNHFRLQDFNDSSMRTGSCHTLTCGLMVSELKDSEGFSLDELASLDICTHFAFRVPLWNGRVRMDSLEVLVSQIRQIQSKYPKLELLLNVYDKDHSDSSFREFYLESDAQEKFTNSIINAMRLYKFTGMQLRLEFTMEQSSKQYKMYKENMLRFLKKHSKLCRKNNWTLDFVLRPPHTMFFENDTIMKISENTRYLLIDFWGFSETDNIPNPMLPYYGTVASLNSLQVFLETHEVDKNKIVPELPFYGKHYAIKGNYTRTHHENETACSPFDLFRGTDGLDYSYLEYREICSKAFDDESNWSLFNDTRNSMYLYDGNSWISTDTTLSIPQKVKALLDIGITRFAVVDVHDDDYNGKSCGGIYPLLKSVFKAIGSPNNCTKHSEHVDISARNANNDTQHGDTKTKFNFKMFAIVVSALLVALLSCFAFVAFRYWITKNKHITSKDNTENGSVKNNLMAIENVSELEIPAHEYKIYSDVLLGKGQFSVVLKGKCLNDDVAVKIPKRNSNAAKEPILQQLNEIEIMKSFSSHKNILQILGISTKLFSTGYIYIFLEFCPLGSVEEYLKQNRAKFINLVCDDEMQFFNRKTAVSDVLSLSGSRDFSTKTIISWTYQVCEGMEYISNNNIVHGDLAARNLLIKSLDEIKICDFGLSKKLNSSGTSFNVSRCEEIKNDAMPWRWMAFELLETGRCSTFSDVWSFGVTIWEIFSLGEVPYAGLEWDSGFISELKSGLRLLPPRNSTSDMYNSFMEPCWALDYEERPSFTTIKSDITTCIHSVFSKGYEDVEIQTPETSISLVETAKITN